MARDVIRLILLFAWLGWRELMSHFRWKRRTDAAERLSRIAAVAVPPVLGLFLLGLMSGLGALAWWGGVLVGAGDPASQRIFLAVKIVVLGALGAMVFVIPVGLSHQVAMTGSERFLLLPIARSRLHLIEVLAGIGNPLILLYITTVAGFAAGLAISGPAAATMAAAAAGLLLVFISLAFGALLGYTAQWLFRDRGRGEIILLVLMILMLSLSSLAPLLDRFEDDWKMRSARGGGAVAGGESGDSDERMAEPASGSRVVSIPLRAPFALWRLIVPSESYGLAVVGGLQGSVPKILAGLAGLALQGGLLLAASSRVHGILLSGTSGSRRRRMAGRDYTIPALPGLSAAAATVAVVQVRTAMRTVRGKLAVFFGGAIILVQSIALRGSPHAGEFLAGFIADGPFLATTAILLTLVFLQPVMYNQFASDREGLALQFLTPVSDQDIVIGKAGGVGLMLAMAMIPCLAMTAVLSPGGSVLAWAAVPFVVLSVYALTSPLAAVLSMYFPRTADLSKLSSAGNAHGLAGVIGVLATALAAIPPTAINFMIGSMLGRPVLALALVAGWAAVCAFMGWLLLNGVARLVSGRRENLVLVAHGR